MTTRAQATAAPVHIPFNGRIVCVSPITDGDFGEFEAWMQKRYYDIIKTGVQDLSPEDRQAVLIDCAKEIPYLTMNSPKARETMTSIEGAAMLLWFALRRKQPEITLGEVNKWITDENNLDEALDTLEHLAPADPTKRVKKTRKRAKRKTATKSRQRNRR